MTNHPNRSKQQQAKHTPGPWTYFVGNSDGRGLIRIEGSHDSPEAGHHIASMARGPVSEANARLIAAAPETAAERDRLKEINAELLAALKSALDFIEEDCAGNDPTTFPPVLHEIRAAITKAEARR